MTGSKGNGSDFAESRLKSTQLTDCAFNYTNFTKAHWERCTVKNCSFKESFLTEMHFNNFKITGTDLSGVDFFRTSLKNLDFSQCTLTGIHVSDSFSELRGLKIAPMQAADLIGLLGIRII